MLDFETGQRGIASPRAGRGPARAVRAVHRAQLRGASGVRDRRTDGGRRHRGHRRLPDPVRLPRVLRGALERPDRRQARARPAGRHRRGRAGGHPPRRRALDAGGRRLRGGADRADRHALRAAEPAQPAPRGPARRHDRAAGGERRGVPGAGVVPAAARLRGLRPQPRRRRRDARAVRAAAVVPDPGQRAARPTPALGLADRPGQPHRAAMHHTPPPGVTHEAFLVSAAAAYQLRQGGPPVPLPPWLSPWGQPGVTYACP